MIVSGVFVGLNNTLTTQAVMAVSPFERSLTSATYGFVRFIGGGVAPYVAARLAAHYNVHVPFYVGAAAELLGIAVLSRGHSLLAVADRDQGQHVIVPAAASPATAASPLPVRPAAGAAVAAASHDDRRAPIVLAIEGQPGADHLCAVASHLAGALDCPLEILHVVETDIAMDQAITTEDVDSPQVRDTLQALVAQAQGRGIPATGHILSVIGEHGDVGRRIATYANDRHARMVVIGAPTHGHFAELIGANTTAELERHVQSDLHIVRSSPSPTPTP